MRNGKSAYEKNAKRKKDSETTDLEFAVDDSSKTLFAKRARQGGDFSNF